MFKEFDFVRGTLGFIVGFSLVFAFVGESKETSAATGSGTMNGNITTIYLQQVKWKVSYANDNSHDETTKFSGYEFFFKDDGTANITKSGVTFAGKWFCKMENNVQKLHLDFGSATPFNSMNHDWEILNSSSSSIRLQNINDGNGSTDFLSLTAE